MKSLWRRLNRIDCWERHKELHVSSLEEFWAGHHPKRCTNYYLKKKNRHGLNLPGVINGVCSVLNSEQGTRSQTLMVLFQPPTLF